MRGVRHQCPGSDAVSYKYNVEVLLLFSLHKGTAYHQSQQEANCFGGMFHLPLDYSAAKIPLYLGNDKMPESGLSSSFPPEKC